MTVYTTTGKAWVVDRCQNVELPAASLMNVLGWGTGATAEAVGNTALATEASENRTTGTLSQPAADTDRVVGTIVATGTKTITEAGRFNITTKGGANEVMLERALFTGIPLLVNDSIQLTFDLQQT